MLSPRRPTLPTQWRGNTHDRAQHDICARNASSRRCPMTASSPVHRLPGRAGAHRLILRLFHGQITPAGCSKGDSFRPESANNPSKARTVCQSCACAVGCPLSTALPYPLKMVGSFCPHPRSQRNLISRRLLLQHSVAPDTESVSHAQINTGQYSTETPQFPGRSVLSSQARSGPRAS